MILRIFERVSNININRKVVRVVRVFNRNVPSGITEASFTAKGQILVGTGDRIFTALPPGANGTYLKYDDGEAAGVKAEIPTFTVDDTTNHLINGGFYFAQRQMPDTLTTIADGTYSADRWKITRENADLQYIRVDASSESSLVSPYYGQFKKITGAGKFLICQPLEYLDTLKFRGKPINFQLQMKASSAKTIKIAVVELNNAGAADTLPTLVTTWGVDGVDPVLGANLSTIGTPSICNVTTNWQVFQFTGTLPVNSKNLLVMVWANADFTAADTLSLAEAGLYYGSVQRTWTPRHIGNEIALCQRYYEKTYSLDMRPGTLNALGCEEFLAYSGNNQHSRRFKVQKNKIPVVTTYSINSGLAAKIYNFSTLADIGSGVESIGMHGASFYTLTSPAAANILFYHWTADSDL